uniref:DUF5899 domain-containing protein n=1 Tax=viral metagenome TaxID=1070528 RepID=A0A6C0IYR5_9ZZZZ
MELLVTTAVVGSLGYLISLDDKPKNSENNLDFEKSQKILKDKVGKRFDDILNNDNNIIPRHYNEKIFSKQSNDVKYKKKNLKGETEPYISSLSGEVINTEDFKHNNMSPYFGGSIKQNTYEKSNEPILDLHTGNNRYAFKKEEKKPMFELKNQDVNGTPNYNGVLKNRYIASNKKTNELPIEQQLIGPGLNNGFNNKPTGGFQQDSRNFVMPKTIDELRVLTNPKMSYKGRVIAGKSLTQKPKNLGNVYKHKPDTFHEKNESHHFTTVGAHTKQKMRPGLIIKNTHRKKTKSYHGSGAPVTFKQPKFKSNYKKPLKTVTLSNGPRNLQAIDKWKNHKYGLESIQKNSNEREITGLRTHTANVTSIVKSIIAPVQDIFKTTRKENFIGNNRESGNYGAKHYKQTVYDPNDITRTTIKETNIHNNHKGSMNGPKRLTVYDPNNITRTTIKETNIHNKHKSNLQGPNRLTVYDPNDITRTTIKETNIHNNHQGNIQGHDALTVYDPNDSTRTTLKETNIHNNHQGNIQGPDGLTVHDPNDITRTTIKETNIHNNHQGNIQGPDGLTVYDPNDITRTTIKQTNIHNNHKGNMNLPERLTMYDPNDITRTTIKETNIHDVRTGNMESTIHSGNIVIDPDDIAKPTLKQTTLDNNYQSNMNMPERLTVYDPNDTTRTTIKETNIHNEHNGNMNGPTRNIVYDPNNVAKTTIKEMHIDNDRVGVVTTENSNGKGYLTNKMIAPNTNKQFTLTNYSGNMNGNTSSKGNGYLVDSSNAPNTNRQFTTNQYAGSANSNNSKPMSYNDVYNATLNEIKEDTLKQRKPTNSNISIPIGVDNIQVQSNKIETDYINNRNSNISSRNDYNIGVHECSMTKIKDQLDNKQINDRIKPEILDSFKSNPYTQSLNSYAFN